MKRVVFFCFMALMLFALGSSGQQLNELQEKKEKTRREIEYTNRLINKTGENTKASLNKLSLLNEQIKLRNNLITDYNTQINLLQQSISDNELVITMLTNDLEKVKTDYANLIKQAYRRRGDYNRLFFLLSSDSFNQAYKRLLYTRQMARYRQKQSEQITEIRDIIQDKTDELQDQKEQKEKLLMQQMQETSKLGNEKKKQSNYYTQLQQRERELKQHLRYQQRIEDRLQREIERIIEEEAKKAKQVAKTPEFLQLSDSFEKNKGRFPWPTSEGVITDKFGEHAHPVMKNIIIKNNGIDITTNPGEKARSIFNGTVSKVFAIPGGNKAVIIRHGEYISVYSNLTDVYVKQGDQVKTLQQVGLIYSDETENDKTILKFQIWKESLKLNPEQWIIR
ncbi:MAG: peptidoglycan DD-metalloendopeptidase family protein [Prolixibacteraceae bacterium]|nr:peptidoglycan DD-metalloendopeptidase family protein [Prolixibacteraceae bacterium]